MPFPMVHLLMADRILDNNSVISRPSQFFLGAVTPDSVHFRKNFCGAYKKASHLLPGEVLWGQVVDEEPWEQCVYSFLRQHKNDKNIDFIYGYCVHILTDIQWNKSIWSVFRDSQNLDKNNIWGSSLHIECKELDNRIAATWGKKPQIFTQLTHSYSEDIPDVVVAAEIDIMRDSLINEQYKAPQFDENFAYNFITPKIIEDFIDSESHYISKNIFEINNIK